MQIGKYTVKGLLGRGGMGAVYKCAMPVTGRLVALKLLAPREILADVAGEERLRRDFLREAVAMAGIRHPNVAQVWDVDRDEQGRHFFVMEYFCNNLGEAMGEGYDPETPTRPLGVEASVSYASQAASALGRLHYAGMVHRDVKPFNFMLSDEDAPKLIDFGLSKLRGETGSAPRGMVVGSPFYTAPEQEDDPARADASSDLYSLGVMLFRMLTGRLPEKGLAARDLNPDLDPDWDALFAGLLHPDQGRRIGDAGQVVAALDGLKSAWERRKKAVCGLPGEEPVRVPAAGGRPPRSVPAKVRVREAREFFRLDGLCRPREYREPGRLEDRGETVFDPDTGLAWERSGSPYRLTLPEAGQYVSELAAKNFGGRVDWRLPTVDELATLFIPNAEPGGMCLEPLFDPEKKRVWSADRKSFTAGWYANGGLGYVWWQDATCRMFVRAVAGGP